MKLSNNIPIYIQVVDDLKKKMARGELSPGQKMISVRDLSFEYKINPNTAGKAYSELEREGLCFTKRGLGTFLTEDGDLLSKMKSDMAKLIINEALLELKTLGIEEDEISLLFEAERRK